MHLTVEDLRRLAGWMRAGGIATLEWTYPNGRLHLVLAPEPAPAAPGRDVTAVAVAPGRFLPAHPIRDAAFAPVGTLVRQGDVLGLVQAGPTYSAVTAPCTGVVRTLMAQPGALVGYGDPIMVLTEQPA
jgi:acetyl-CoA carboxylase biotin carboxyl carrier protein